MKKVVKLTKVGYSFASVFPLLALVFIFSSDDSSELILESTCEPNRSPSGWCSVGFDLLVVESNTLFISLADLRGCESSKLLPNPVFSKVFPG